MLLSEACTAYMEAKSKKLRQTTLDGYVSGLRCHVLPMWGGRELESIRRREVQEWADGFELPTNGSNVYVAQMLVTHGGVIYSRGKGGGDWDIWKVIKRDAL